MGQADAVGPTSIEGNFSSCRLWSTDSEFFLLSTRSVTCIFMRSFTYKSVYPLLFQRVNTDISNYISVTKLGTQIILIIMALRGHRGIARDALCVHASLGDLLSVSWYTCSYMYHAIFSPCIKFELLSNFTSLYTVFTMQLTDTIFQCL